MLFIFQFRIKSITCDLIASSEKLEHFYLSEKHKVENISEDSLFLIDIATEITYW